jgi:hypothetical protein
MQSGSNRPRSIAGPLVLLILGSFAAIIGLAVLAGGVALAAFNGMRSQDGGFFTTPRTALSVDSYALTSPRLDIAGDLWIPANLAFDVATFRLEASPADPDQDLFIGIGPRSDVERYLSSVHHSELQDLNYRPFHVEYRDIAGSQAPAPPERQTFWTESASGTGNQTITWQPQSGEWTIVIMNADATSGVDAEMAAGFRTDVIWPVSIGLMVAGGLLFLVGLAMLIPGAVGLARRGSAPPQQATAPGYPNQG